MRICEYDVGENMKGYQIIRNSQNPTEFTIWEKGCQNSFLRIAFNAEKLSSKKVSYSHSRMLGFVIWNAG